MKGGRSSMINKILVLLVSILSGMDGDSVLSYNKIC